MRGLLFSWPSLPRQTQAHRQQHGSEVAVASLLLARRGQVFVWRIGWPHQPAGSAHRSQIIFVRRSTIEAHLIILAMSPGMRPGEPMGAEPCQEPLEELECHPAFNSCRGEFARHLCGLRTKLTHNVSAQPHTLVHRTYADGQCRVSLPASKRQFPTPVPHPENCRCRDVPLPNRMKPFRHFAYGDSRGIVSAARGIRSLSNARLLSHLC
jgi:hypothetical protein